MTTGITVTKAEIAEKSDPAGILNDLSFSVAKEIVDMADTNDLPSAATKLGFVQPGTTITNIKCDQAKWTRVGGETYALSFRLNTDTDQNPHLILKAAVTMNPESRSESSLERREHLGNHGIRVPKLWGYYNAMILEEFVEEDIHDAAEQDIGEVLRQSAAIFGTLSRLGYKPIPRGVLRDLRWDGEKLVMIDFGSDLGAPDEKYKGSDLWEIFQNDAAATLNISPKDSMRYKDCYDAARKDSPTLLGHEPN